MTMFDSACDFVGPARDANLARAKSLGCTVISAYIVGTPGNCAHVSRDDVAAILAHGMGVYANWERAADFFRNATPAQCQAAGAEALAAMSALGFPAGSVCAPSWDYDVANADYAAELVKAQAFAKGLSGRYRMSAYAEIGLINYFVAHGAIPHGVKGWLCMSEGFSAPGEFAGSWANVAVVQQHDAAKKWLNPTQPGTDINTIVDAAALGAWWPAGAQPDSTTTTPITTAEDDMTPEQAQQLNDLHTWFTGGVGPGQRTAGGTIATTLRTVQAIYNRVMALPTQAGGATIDVNALADALAGELGPNLAKELIDELGKRIAP